MMASKIQIKLIHTLRAKLDMNEEEYRASLIPFSVTSSTEMTEIQAKEYIHALIQVAVRRGVWKKMRSTLKPGRPDDFATPDQIAMLQAAWASVSRARGAEARATALNRFIYRRWGFGSIEMLPRDTVAKVRHAIDHMQPFHNVVQGG